MRDYILIEDLAADDRPREKALRNGINSLSNAELIAIIFGNGIKGKSVLTMSQELLARNNGRLSDIARKGIREIVKENITRSSHRTRHALSSRNTDRAHKNRRKPIGLRHDALQATVTQS